MLRLVSLIAAILIAVPAAAALNHFWEGDGPNPNFSTHDNWLNDYYPLNNGTGYLRFGYSAETSPVVDAAWNIAGLNFDEAIGSFSLSGQPLSIGDLGIEVDGFANLYSQSIANDILLTANQTWLAETNPLTVTGDLSLQNKVLKIDGTKGVTLAGNPNLGFIDVLAGGKLTLSGTVTCDIDNQGGTLVVATDQPQFPGSNLQFSGTSRLGATGNRNTGVSLDTSGELTFIGPGAMTAANGIRGSGSLVMDAAGATLGLGGGYFFPFAGAVNIKAGKLEMLAAQPGVPALTGAITVGDGIGPADEAMLELAADGIVQMNFGWIPQVAADGALVLGGDQTVTEFELTGGRFACTGTFQTESARANASSRTARIEGTWETPALGGLDVIEVADGAAEPDLLFSVTKQGPGGLMLTGAGHVEMTGAISATEGRIVTSGVSVTLARTTGLSDLPSFTATDSDIACPATNQFGTGCDVSLTRTSLDPGTNLTQKMADLVLDDTIVDNFRSTLWIHGDIDVPSSSSLICDVYFPMPTADIAVGPGQTLTARNFSGQVTNLTGQGYVETSSMTGDVNVLNGTLIAAGDFETLFVQSSLNVDVDKFNGVLDISDSITLHADSDVTLTLRNTNSYSRIDAYGGISVNGVANLDGYLEVMMDPAADISPGDEFTLVAAGTLNGTFSSILIDPTPEPDQSWVLTYTGQTLILKLEGPDVSSVEPTPTVITEMALTAVPNPFNPRTSVQFDLPAAGPARIDVVDVQGRRVARLVDAELPVGRHTVSFDGRDNHGRHLPSGIYFVQLQSAAGAMTRKVTLLQ